MTFSPLNPFKFAAFVLVDVRYPVSERGELRLDSCDGMFSVRERGINAPLQRVDVGKGCRRPLVCRKDLGEKLGHAGDRNFREKCFFKRVSGEMKRSK